MKPQDRIAAENEMARRAVLRAMKNAIEAAEQLEKPNNGKNAPSYIGRAIQKLKDAEAHLNRAQAEKEKNTARIAKMHIIQ